MAQGTVFSVNAVGYVNVTLKPGFNLVGNPLVASDNTVGGLAAGISDGTSVQIFKLKANASGFDTASLDPFGGGWTGAAATQNLLPGEGVFIRNPGTTDRTWTFVGEVMQGTLTNAYPAGFSIRASQVPLEKKIDELGFVGKGGDQIYQHSPTLQKYDIISSYDVFAGNFPGLRALRAGEAFFLKAQAAGNWVQTFSVNVP